MLDGHVLRIVAEEMGLKRTTSQAKEEAKRQRKIKQGRKDEEKHDLRGPTSRVISKATRKVKGALAATSNLLRQAKTAEREGENSVITHLNLKKLASQCQQAAKAVETAKSEVLVDLEEFEENVGAVEYHRPTDRHARERERNKTKSFLHGDDWFTLQATLTESGCPDTLEEEDSLLLGKPDEDDEAIHIWMGPDPNTDDDFVICPETWIESGPSAACSKNREDMNTTRMTSENITRHRLHRPLVKTFSLFKSIGFTIVR